MGEYAELDCPALVVGGSLVGLSAACFLAVQGVRPLVIEKHAGTSIHPRAGYFHIGTMEAYRRIGLEAAISEASRAQFGPDGGINAVESLAGRELARHVPDINAGVAPYSPCRRFFMTQQSLEPLLHDRAAELGARLRYRTELVGFEDRGDQLFAEVRDLENGEVNRIRTRYMIAADGNRSPVRAALGIGVSGPGWLSDSITIYFRADCRPWLEGRQLGVIYVVNADQRGFFRFEAGGTRGFLAVNTLGDLSLPDAKDVSGDLSPKRCMALVRSAVGVPDLAVELEDVATWKAEAVCAEAYRKGRVFLAGDAAHVVPPTGGFGGNTGVQDAANLAWKLAMVVKGEAGAALLDSYEAERRPVGQLTVEQAHARYIRRVVPEEITADTPEMRDELTMEIGQYYRSGAVIGGRGEDEPACMHPDATQGHPGSRIPHAWLEDGRSTADLAAAGLTLLLGQDAGSDCTLPQVRLPVDAATACGLGPGDALIARPDGFVAWRGPASDAVAALRSVIAP
ncbi:monooxygenase [Altererythrobacter salegens]|uniref:Monooxygenase n=1 Tax=Croceibacterium salegens TaxID=1737568 RepID=A0A6I4SXG3_9SPHN|nr:FAD-dependent monooxygenase [Croceibacterium salegens]MXO60029.1 monooxygenase [Croceibacterium salegens]